MIPGPKVFSQNEQQNKNSEIIPQYWNILSDSDKNGYLSLRSEISILNTKKIFRDRTGTFTKILQLIQKYAERKDDDDWKRFLVCGICWVDNGIAVNIRQLKILISKCKSSINGSLQKLGYLPSQLHVNTKLILFPLIPFLSKNYNELRQWTIRFFQKYDSFQRNENSLNIESKNEKNLSDSKSIRNLKSTERLEMHPIPLINVGQSLNNDNSIQKSENLLMKRKILMPILIEKNESTTNNLNNIENKTKIDETETPFIIIPPKFRSVTDTNFQNIK